MIKKIFIMTMLLFAMPVMASEVILPALTGPVVDTAGMLTPEQVKQLSAKSIAFEKAKGSQIAICIVPTIQPLPIEDFGIKLAEKWKIGRAKIADGIIIIIAKNDRKMRIEVGRGLEGIITDLRAGRIITQIMAPEFRKGDFYKGIDSAFDAITIFINGGDIPAISASKTSVQKSTDSSGTGFGIALIVIAVILFILFFFMKKILKSVLMLFGSYAMTAAALHSMDVGTVGESIGFASIIMVPLCIGVFFAKYGGGGGEGGGYSSDSSYSSYSSSSSDSSYSSSSSDSYSGGGGDFGGGGSSGDW